MARDVRKRWPDSEPPPPPPMRGVPGGWKDRWDSPDLDAETVRLSLVRCEREQYARAVWVRSLPDDAA